MRQARGRLAAVLLAAMVAVAGCVTPDGQLAVETFGRGMANLILAPLMIVAGIAQGLAFLPYTIGMGLAELNRSLIEASADAQFAIAPDGTITDVNEEATRLTGYSRKHEKKLCPSAWCAEGRLS